MTLYYSNHLLTFKSSPWLLWLWEWQNWKTPLFITAQNAIFYV